MTDKATTSAAGDARRMPAHKALSVHGRGFFTKSVKGQLEAFAEALAEHDAGAGNPGGDLIAVAYRLRLTIQQAENMLARLRRDLGGQAR